MEEFLHGASARRLVVCLVMAAAAFAVAAQLIEGPPGNGYGWGSVVVSCLLLAVPLIALGLMVRSGERRFVWASTTVAVLMTALLLAALVGNWSGQSSSSRVLDAATTLLLIAASVGVLVVELPLLRRDPDEAHHRAAEGPAERR